MRRSTSVTNPARLGPRASATVAVLRLLLVGGPVVAAVPYADDVLGPADGDDDRAPDDAGVVDDGAEGEVERLFAGVDGRRTAAEAPVVTCTTGGVVTTGVAVVVFVGGDDGVGVVGATVSVVPGVFTVVVVTGKLTVTVVDGTETVIVVMLGRPIDP